MSESTRSKAKSKGKSRGGWTREDWGTKSGKKYLPKKARENITDKEYNRSTAKKRAAARKGEQYSKQPEDIADKTSKYRS